MTSYQTAIVDAPLLTRRAYHAAGPDAMIEQAEKLIANFQTYHDIGMLIFVWESPEPGYKIRRSIPGCEGYKSKRKPPGPAYYDAIPGLRAWLPSMGVYQIDSNGEADDIAATLVRTWPGPHLLWSTDKDWLQLIAPSVHIIRPDCSKRPKDIPREHWRRPPSTLITADNIESETGLTARGWTEFLCLCGDSTDSIPGLPNIGKTRAMAIHAACPNLVELVLSNQDGTARAQAAAHDNSAMQWVELAISSREALRASAAMVHMYDVTLNVTEPAPDLASAEWNPQPNRSAT